MPIRDEEGNSLDNLIGQAILDVTIYFKWEPGIVSRLLWHKEDHTGLLYWWDIVKQLTKK